MFVDLPTSSYLRRAFAGGAAWYEGTQPGRRGGEREESPTAGESVARGRAGGGFTGGICGGISGATLNNGRGEGDPPRRLPFPQLGADPPHLRGPINDAAV